MKKLFIMMCTVIISVISFADTPVTIHSYGNSDLRRDIVFMTSYDTIKVKTSTKRFESKKIDSIDINFVPFSEEAPKGTQVTINVRLHVEGKYCDFIFWIESRSRPKLSEKDVAADIVKGDCAINDMIATYMEDHKMKYVILEKTKKIEKKG